MFVDFPLPGGNANQVLMRFDNLFGNGQGQIPSNAIIVSADLSLHLLDSGDGTPLYRMLMPFDENNATWDGFGGGVDPDNTESRSTYDSVFGLIFATSGSTNSPNTGVGTITFSVLPDVKAWQNGGTNYGWVLPGSDLQNDGLGISPGESSNPNDRPKLRISWVPAGTVSATFRQGFNGYTSAQDTRIQASTPDADGSALASVFVDWAVTGPDENDAQVLIKFENIIGYGAGQITPNSIIHAAVLDVNSTDFSNAMGDGGTFHSMLAPWDHTNTWNQLVNGVTADDIEAVSAPTTIAGNASLNPNIEAAFHVFDLTGDVQAWASGTRPNYGWVILPWPNGGDGWGLNTSDAATEIQRPQLRVYYTPGPAAIIIQSITRTATTVTIRFSGEIGTTYTVRRAGTVDGTYVGLIPGATVQPDGIATFTDNSPPAGAAFYRISNP
ncbi:MAG: DNRLRE domain-containing protein [Verrucomicrobiota bacterium]